MEHRDFIKKLEDTVKVLDASRRAFNQVSNETTDNFCAMSSAVKEIWSRRDLQTRTKKTETLTIKLSKDGVETSLPISRGVNLAVQDFILEAIEEENSKVLYRIEKI